MNPKFNPLVSVCVITYNQESYIQRCLLSVLNQKTNFEIEIIVSDDCSTDNTANIIRDISIKHPGKIKGILRDKNIGGVKNYVETHKSASGQYIAHLDGDDEWLPNKLSEQVEFLKNNPQCSAVYTNATVIDDFGNELGKFNRKLPSLIQREFLLEKGNFLTASSLLYKRSLVDRVIPIGREFIDYQIHLRCSQIGSLGYLNQLLVVYRIHAGGATSRSITKLLELYWVALAEAVESDGITPSVRSAIIDFIAMAFCRAIIEKDFSIKRKWVDIIHEKTKIHKLQLITFGAVEAISKIVNSIRKRVLRSVHIKSTYASR